MGTEENQAIDGGCYCGGVRFVIASGAKPMFKGYCHCRDCRQAHAAPLYQFAYMVERDFRIVEGSELLEWYTREESRREAFKRFFCKRCGTKVFNYMILEPNGEEVRGVFPSLFDDQKIAESDVWAPDKHVNCGAAIMDLSAFIDDLPRNE
jgi:hypothetical protein